MVWVLGSFPRTRGFGARGDRGLQDLSAAPWLRAAAPRASWPGRLVMGSGSFQPGVSASNTAPAGGAVELLGPSRCLMV